MFDTARWASPSRNRSITIGDARISYVLDGAVQLDPRWLGASVAQAPAPVLGHLDREGYLVGSVGALLIEHDGHRMLIDAGYGSHRVPAEVTPDGLGRLEGGLLTESLHELGVTPDQIEAVAFTHLHDDHLGWAPLFDQARYVVSEAEWAWWRTWGDPAKAETLQARLDVDGSGREIIPGVSVFPTPGHTPGHTAYVLESGGERLIAFGDVMHSPIQFADPRWGSANDSDRAQAVASRHAVIGELSDDKTVGFGGHFADVVFGQVHDDPAGRRLRWHPVD